jgi:hypothetical protein
VGVLSRRDQDYIRPELLGDGPQDLPISHEIALVARSGRQGHIDRGAFRPILTNFIRPPGTGIVRILMGGEI